MSMIRQDGEPEAIARILAAVSLSNVLRTRQAAGAMTKLNGDNRSQEKGLTPRVKIFQDAGAPRPTSTPQEEGDVSVASTLHAMGISSVAMSRMAQAASWSHEVSTLQEEPVLPAMRT